MKNQNNQKTGFLLVDKNTGPTSFNIVHQLRKITGIRKIGHAGTLDPFASGLLILAISRSATKQINSFMKLDKVYEAEFCFGATTETLDPEGNIVIDEDFKVININEDLINNSLKKFIGPISQTPPIFSAIKINGQKAYDLARKGLNPEIKSREIEIYSFKLNNYRQENNLIFANFTIHCGSGTYIRSLARDLAKEMNTVGYCTALRRTKIGPYSVKDAHRIEEILPDTWENLLLTNHHQIDNLNTEG